MRQSETDFRVKLDAAREWELRLAAWVRSRGWFVVPTYDFSGKGDDKAPKLLAPHGARDLVLPDLQCFRDGAHQWLECKWKARAVLYRKGGYPTTGISTRLLRDYRDVEQRTGAQVILAFLHEAEREVRGASLAQLAHVHSHDYGGPKMGPCGMTFWRYLDIPRWGALHEVADGDCEAAE